MASFQIPLSSAPRFPDIPPISHCHRIWVSTASDSFLEYSWPHQDTRAAQFTPCALPFVATIPAILAALVLLKYSLRVIDGYWPRWTKPFVHEAKEKSSEAETPSTRRPVIGTFSLLALATIGLTFQILNVFFPSRQPTAIYPAIAWVLEL